MTTIAVAAPTGTYTIDPAHSNVEFAVKHLGIATVKGSFATFEGTLELGPAAGGGTQAVARLPLGRVTANVRAAVNAE